jgi:putative phage-type endonuclease
MNEIHDNEWYQRRRYTLNASEVAAVLGLSKWATAYDVWLSKIEDVRSESSEAARWGHKLQPLIAEEAVKRGKLQIIETEIYKKHATESWAAATCDYICKNDNNQSIILEIKATRDLSWPEIPIDYRMQVAWQSFVTGIPTGQIAVLHASSKLRIYDFPDLSDWFDDVIEACRTFWFDHVVAKIPPKKQLIEEEALEHIIATPGKKVTFDLAAQVALVELASIREEMKELSERKSMLEEKIKFSMQDSEIGLMNGKTVVTWKESTMNRFDSTAFRKDQPALYNKYIKKQTCRRFLIKDSKIKQN